jgi:hypothetical protein
MRIKSFLFARQIERGPDQRLEVHQVSDTPFLDGPPQHYPARLSRPALVTLQRDSNAGSSSVQLRCQLVAPTGPSTRYPCPAPFQADFEDGSWTCHLPVQVNLAFPAPGRYRLDILLEGGQPHDVYSLWIDPSVPERSTRLVYEQHATTVLTVVETSRDPTTDQVTRTVQEGQQFSRTINS